MTSLLNPFVLPDLDAILKLRAELDIVHHIPGRLRLRLGPGLLEWARDHDLDPDQAAASLRAFPGMTGTRLNAAAASLVLEYDPKRLDPADWETLLLGSDDEALGLVLSHLADG